MTEPNPTKVAIITGGAKRIGAEIARTLHKADYQLVIHYRYSASEAEKLSTELNKIRNGSCQLVAGKLEDQETYETLIATAKQKFGQIDALINNASSFYPTPIEEITEENWQELMTSNLKAPLFLSKHAIPELKKTAGNIINIVDIYADRPIAEHPIYCCAKAGLQMLTKSLAQDLKGQIRVNGVAPGAILWPENDYTNDNANDPLNGPLNDNENNNGQDKKQALLDRIPMRKLGQASDIANTVKFLLEDAPYINGQIIAVDGGRTVVP